MDALTRGLLSSNEHDVKIVTISTDKHPFLPHEMDENYRNSTKIEAVHLDTQLRKLDALSDLVTGDSYNISRFFSLDFERVLTDILRKQRLTWSFSRAYSPLHTCERFANTATVPPFCVPTTSNIGFGSTLLVKRNR